MSSAPSATLGDWAARLPSRAALVVLGAGLALCSFMNSDSLFNFLMCWRDLPIFLLLVRWSSISLAAVHPRDKCFGGPCSQQGLAL